MRPRSATTAQRGAAAVEMALVLPLLLTVLFGIFEYGRYFSLRSTVTAAATEGARQAVLPDSSGNRMTQAQLTTWVANFLTANAITAQAQVAMSPTSLTAGQPVQVSVSIPFTPLVLPQFLGEILFPARVAAAASMTVEP